MPQDEPGTDSEPGHRDYLQTLIIVFFVGSLVLLGGLIAAFAMLTESVH